jgi:TPR repeat protein
MRLRSMRVNFIEVAAVIGVSICITVIYQSNRAAKNTVKEFDLQEEEKVALVVLAVVRFDSGAAVKLGKYYRWSTENYKESEKWYSYAATLGDAAAIEETLRIRTILQGIETDRGRVE